MLALQPRAVSPFTTRALEFPEPAEIFAQASWTRGADGPVPPPERYRDLAKKYGTVGWIYAAVSRKMTDVASVPLRVVTRTGDNAAVTETTLDHPLRRLLERANPFMTWFDVVEGACANLDLAGNAYALKFSDRAGRPRELWPMRPDYVTILASPTNYLAGYRVRAGSETFDFLPSQVLHWKLFNPLNDYYGLGSISAAWNASSVAESAGAWNRNMLVNAGRLDGVLISDKPLTKAQAEENAQRWRELYTGPRNAGRTAVLGSGLKWQAVSTTPKELDYVLSLKLTREEILAVLGVRPMMLGLEAGDIGRRSEQIRDYFYGTVRGRLFKIVEVFSEFLVPDFREAGLEILPDIETALLPYEDRLALAQADEAHIRARVLVPNEVRRRIGLPPRAGGDIAYVQNNMIAEGASTTSTAMAPVA